MCIFFDKNIKIFPSRLYRAYYEAKSNIIEMWKGNPALASVLFGLPFGFFALICYSICCADIMDAEEDDDEEEQTLAAASRAASGSGMLYTYQFISLNCPNVK